MELGSIFDSVHVFRNDFGEPIMICVDDFGVEGEEFLHFIEEGVCVYD